MNHKIAVIALVFTLLFTVPAFAAGHSFQVEGTVVSWLDYYGEVSVLVQTGSGPGVNTYQVKCGNGVLSACQSLISGDWVSMSGPIVQQSKNYLQHVVVFRAESMQIMRSALGVISVERYGAE